MQTLAKRETIDKRWIDRVRKTWKAWTKQAKSAGYMEAAKRLGEGRLWVEKLANDLAYSKGFFVFLREKKQQTEIYKWRVKALEHLKSVAATLAGGERAVEFWEAVATPGTREYEMGAAHRYELEKDPAGLEKAMAKTIRGTTTEAVTKADAEFSRQFLALLTRIVNKWGDIEWGSFEREFNIGDVRVVMVDLPTPFPQEAGKGHLPSDVNSYVRELIKAQALLKQKGLGFLWYGPMFVSCKTCGGDNPRGKQFGVGANYRPSKDTVTIFADPGGLARLVAHELGHRYYYRFMSSADRARFADEFGDIPAVSEYGATVPEEDFAEVFSYYIDNRNLTRPQVERLKRFLTKKGRRSSLDPDRLMLLYLAPDLPF